MIKQFFIDLENAKAAEELVRDTLASLAPSITFELVADEPEYFHKGDIKATAADGTVTMIEVKDDSRIADTGNILCEEKVYYNSGYSQKGFMHSDY